MPNVPNTPSLAAQRPAQAPYYSLKWLRGVLRTSYYSLRWLRGVLRDILLAQVAERGSLRVLLLAQVAEKRYLGDLLLAQVAERRGPGRPIYPSRWVGEVYTRPYSLPGTLGTQCPAGQLAPRIWPVQCCTPSGCALLHF